MGWSVIFAIFYFCFDTLLATLWLNKVFHEAPKTQNLWYVISKAYAVCIKMRFVATANISKHHLCYVSTLQSTDWWENITKYYNLLERPGRFIRRFHLVTFFTSLLVFCSLLCINHCCERPKNTTYQYC